MDLNEWGLVNKVYAGLGQLINQRKDKDNNISALAEEYGGRMKETLDILVKAYTKKNWLQNKTMIERKTNHEMGLMIFYLMRTTKVKS